MTHEAKDLFSDWYKVIDPQLTNEIVTMRNSAIEEILTYDNEGEFWLDIVRLYLGAKPKDPENLNLFVTDFHEKDNTFPLLGNERLVKTLASIVLCYKLEENEFDINDKISIAVLNANFLGQYEPTSGIPVEEFAWEHILIASATNREVTYDETNLDTLEEKVNASPDPIGKEILLSITKEIKSVGAINKNLLEETNILWWLFGEYCNFIGDYFKNIGAQKMTVFSAKELSDLSSYFPGVPSAKQILHRVQILSYKSKKSIDTFSLKEIIDLLDDDIKNKLLDGVNDSISDMTPCLSALKKSLEFPKGEDWSGSFAKQNNEANPAKKFDLGSLSFQFYKEFTYSKLFA